MDAELHKKSLDFSENKNTIYDNWADTYEDYVKSIGYLGPKNFARIFLNLYMKDRLVNKIDNQKLRILDFGCGTGLLGMNVFKELNNNIELVGVDISDKMIEKAKDKKVYTSIYNLNMLDVELNTIKELLGNFDYIISCGVFLEGHVPFTIVNKLKQLVKHNIVFTVRESFIYSRSEEYDEYVKKNDNYQEYDIEYLDNVKCKLIII